MSSTVPIVAIGPFVVILCAMGLAALVAVLIFMLIFSALRKSKSRGGASSAEEARIMQELHQGMRGLETRIENLETVLLNHEQDKSGL